MLREPIVSRVRAILLSHPQAKFYNEPIKFWIRAVTEIEPDRAEWHAVHVGGITRPVREAAGKKAYQKYDALN